MDWKPQGFFGPEIENLERKRDIIRVEGRWKERGQTRECAKKIEDREKIGWKNLGNQRERERQRVRESRSFMNIKL